MVKHFEEVHAKAKQITLEEDITLTAPQINYGTGTAFVISAGTASGVTISTGTATELTMDGTRTSPTMVFVGSATSGQIFTGATQQCSGTGGGWLEIAIDGGSRFIQLYTGTAAG